MDILQLYKSINVNLMVNLMVNLSGYVYMAVGRPSQRTGCSDQCVHPWLHQRTGEAAASHGAL